VKATAIVGMPTTNNITIQDDGSNNANNIIAFANGKQFRPNVSINRVNFQGSSDRDLITYNVNGGVRGNRNIFGALDGGADAFRMTIRRDIDPGVQMNVSVSGGGGADVLSETLIGNMSASSRLQLAFSGGAGADRINFDTTSFVAVADRAEIILGLEGGLGNDRIGVTYNGLLDGALNFRANADGGNDFMTATLTLTKPSTGSVVPSILAGGTGDDFLRFIVHNSSTKAITFNQILNGGPGIDTAVRTNDVNAYNVESNFLVQ